MKWVQITCVRVQPTTGTYSDWKPQIAKECKYRCVYCAILDSDFGGIVHFHVEHFRPKSIEEFKKLENDIKNLFYACSVCNRFKTDIWPGEPDETGGTPTFLDPSRVDYNSHMALRGADHQVEGKSIAGKFAIERMFLNRPQLVLARRAHAVSTQIAAYARYFAEAKEELKKIDTVESRALLSELLDRLVNLLLLDSKLKKTHLYGASDTKRPPIVKPRRSTARRRR